MGQAAASFLDVSLFFEEQERAQRPREGEKARDVVSPLSFLLPVIPRMLVPVSRASSSPASVLRLKSKRLRRRQGQAVLWNFQTMTQTLVIRFEFLRWKNLVRLHEIEKILMVYKSLQELAPGYLCCRFTITELD